MTKPRRGLAGTADAVVRLSRPQFLAGGVVMHGLGVAAAAFAGLDVDGRVALWGQVAITATQLVTHYTNEVFDIEADRASVVQTAWSGGSRVLADGTLPRRAGLWLAVLAAAVASVAAVVLRARLHTGPWTLPLVALAVAVAWSYSAPPARLHGRGLGEVAAALLMAGLTPYVGFYLQGGRDVPLLIAIVAPIVLLQFAMLIVVSLPDAPGDGAVGKRTLAVRWGTTRAARGAAAAIVGGFGVSIACLALSVPVAAVVAVWVWSPLGAWQARRLWRLQDGPADWSSVGFWGIGLVMGPAASVTMALAIATLTGP